MSTLTVGTISEKVTDAGVAIDGVTLKDGELGTTASPVAIHSSSLNGGQFGGRRNMIINGAMQVAQRGTSFTLENNSVKYPVDRFFVHDTNSSAGEATISQSTTAPTDFKNSLKIDVTTADTALVADDQYKIEYRIEGQDIEQLNYGTSSAKTVTLSFYIRSNKTGNTQVALNNSANDRAYIATFTIDSANTWERKELTISGSTDGTWLNDNQTGLRLRWGSFGSNYQTSTLNQWITDSSAYVSQANSRNDSPINFFDSTDNELYITGVQLEVGEQATPFEHRSFGEELALCQRYFKRIEVGSSIRISTSAYADTTTRARFIIYHSPEMKSTATVSVTNGDLDGQALSAIATVGSTNLNDVIMTRSSGSHSTGDILQVHTSANTATLDFASEL